MSEPKEKDKTPERELNKMELSDLSEAEFKTLVIKILTGEGKGRDKFSENFNKEIENVSGDRKHKKE